MRGPAEPTHPRRETRRDQTHYWKEKLGTIDGTRRALTTSIGRRPLERATSTNLPASSRCAIAQRLNSTVSMQNNFQDFAFDLNSSSPRIFSAILVRWQALIFDWSVVAPCSIIRFFEEPARRDGNESPVHSTRTQLLLPFARIPRQTFSQHAATTCPRSSAMSSKPNQSVECPEAPRT
jgi:hypothetical protein